MKLLKVLYIILLFSLFSCTTIKFGQQDKIIFEEKNKLLINEFDLSYSYKVMGVPVKGSKSIVENLFVHPDNKTLFLCLSFPKIGILKTEDGGKTFKEHFFKLGYLEKAFGYSAENNYENNKKEQRNSVPFRFFYHFAVSPNDPDKIAISMGPYLLISKDKGNIWESKNIFFDMQNTNIRDVFITERDELIVLSENKISVSCDWGKRWEKRTLKIDKTPFFKLEYVSGVYDNKNETLFASIKFNEDPDSLLSKSSYEFFYKNVQPEHKSGLFISKDKGITWSKMPVNIPLALWQNKDTIYGGPVYPLGIYENKYSESFMEADFYKDGKLDNSTGNIEEYIESTLNSSIEKNMILSKKYNKLVKFSNSLEKYEIIEEKKFDDLYIGIKKTQDLDFIQWEDYWYDKKKSNQFFYEYNFWKMFKLWTGYRTNSPYLYEKTNNGIYFRIRPHPEFLIRFIKYSVEKQIIINSKNPFLKKKTDIEFFDPAYDPTGGFPAVIEFSNDKGKTWKQAVESDHFARIIDPLSNKRSGFYWYKNVDQKKMFKLQISFGFDQGVNLMVYPMKIISLEDKILLNINYFSVSKSYKDLYQIPLKLIE